MLCKTMNGNLGALIYNGKREFKGSVLCKPWTFKQTISYSFNTPEEEYMAGGKQGGTLYSYFPCLFFKYEIFAHAHAALRYIDMCNAHSELRLWLNENVTLRRKEQKVAAHKKREQFLKALKHTLFISQTDWLLAYLWIIERGKMIDNLFFSFGNYKFFHLIIFMSLMECSAAKLS